jgi:hypothetical protein
MVRCTIEVCYIKRAIVMCVFCSLSCLHCLRLTRAIPMREILTRATTVRAMRATPTLTRT